ncbi:MAG: hypothetical protein RJA37_1025 [Verrucomicrobiota bacterium]|jgi:hypothetical protein
MREAAALLAALLAGCVARAPVRTPEETLPPFSRPPGSPASVRAGFVEPVRAGAVHCAVVLSPDSGVRIGDTLVSRDRALRPTAVLEVEMLSGRTGLARIRRGRPGAKEEAVRPSTELRQLAETLAPAPGT